MTPKCGGPPRIRGRNVRSEETCLENAHDTPTGDELAEVGAECGGQGRCSEAQHHDGNGDFGGNLLAEHSGRGATDAEGNEVVGQCEIELVVPQSEVLHEAGRVGVGKVAAVQGAIDAILSDVFSGNGVEETNLKR